MGDAVLSAFLQVLFQGIADFVKNDLQSGRRFEKEKESLVSNVATIQAVLRGAEKKIRLSESQESLFARLKDASYHGAEVLDEYLYEVQRRQVVHLHDLRTYFSVLNPLRIKFEHDMENKIKAFAEEINGIKGMKEMYSAFQTDSQDTGGGGLDPTTSLPPTVVFGRHDDQENICSMILQPDRNCNVAVLPILGDAYVGKTTVAQLVLNDNRASQHFELRLWVHVSREFNIERITSSIIESIEGFPFHRDNLNTLQMRLEKLLRGRRYLLVLDDYCNENWQDWDKLKRSFLSGAGGSKIIVTTRSERVARVLGTLPRPYKLQRLQNEYCWLLFCQCAQGTERHGHNNGHALDTRLKEEVLRKCKGVPFIAASLGYSINQEKDRSKWLDSLRKENWDSSSNHFNKALRLNYAQLDYFLKPCFAYSAIIPQTFQFEKEWLIKHWMAQDFIRPNNMETIEETGRSYFRSLVDQSFFQIAHVDRTGEEHSYRLSEMMHDIASRVSGADCRCYRMGTPYNLSENVRHLTVIFNKVASQDMFDFDLISCSKFLHTFIVLGGSENLELKIPDDIDKRFTRLRTLDFSNFGVALLPESIGKLKHLRCLQLQGTKIKCLPESICDLYHLQTLGLRNCYDLEELPHGLKNLLKLRHIDLAMNRDPCHNMCSLRCMPKDIGMLKDLQTLSRFVISKRSHLSLHTHRGGIQELANLDNLRGTLLILNLHLVKDMQESKQARLASKQFLQKLELSWSNSNNEQADQTFPKSIKLAPKKFFDFPSSSKDDEEAEKILNHLEAPTSIKVLTLLGYPGMTCPSWLGSTDYSNLVTMSLWDFKRCDVLPSLGLLPHLENLHLKGWDSLVSMNCHEFCGSCCSVQVGAYNAFQSLKKLHLERMSRLQRWEGDDRCAYPNLLELVIENCCKLEQVTHSLPSLTKITVEGSPGFFGLRNFPSLKHVKVNDSGEWIWGSWRSLSSPISISLCKLPTVSFPSGSGHGMSHESLQRLEISNCEQLLCIPEDWPPCSNLTHLSVRHCPRLSKLPRCIERLEALEDMEIVACEKLNYLPDMSGLRSLIRLEVSDCASIQFLPNTGLPGSLQVLSINNCRRLAESYKNVRSTDRRAEIKRTLVWIDGQEVSASAAL